MTAATKFGTSGWRAIIAEDFTFANVRLAAPAIAHEIIRRKIDGAINFTASHNPAEFQGLKFSGPDGGPALPEVTHDIEARAAKMGERAPAKANDGAFEKIDPRGSYLERLGKLVNFKAMC